MNTNVYINLPVADIGRSRKFFTALGFTFDERFSGESSLGMIISDTSFAMLLTHEHFAQFTPKPIADAHTSTEVLTCLQLGSREDVDRMVETALAAAGGKVRDTQDLGFMYGRAFQDLDGHIWEVIWMDPTGMPGKDAEGEKDHV